MHYIYHCPMFETPGQRMAGPPPIKIKPKPCDGFEAKPWTKVQPRGSTFPCNNMNDSSFQPTCVIGGKIEMGTHYNTTQNTPKSVQRVVFSFHTETTTHTHPNPKRRRPHRWKNHLRNQASSPTNRPLQRNITAATNGSNFTHTETKRCQNGPTPTR